MFPGLQELFSVWEETASIDRGILVLCLPRSIHQRRMGAGDAAACSRAAFGFTPSCSPASVRSTLQNRTDILENLLPELLEDADIDPVSAGAVVVWQLRPLNCSFVGLPSRMSSLVRALFVARARLPRARVASPLPQLSAQLVWPFSAAEFPTLACGSLLRCSDPLPPPELALPLSAAALPTIELPRGSLSGVGAPRPRPRVTLRRRAPSPSSRVRSGVGIPQNPRADSAWNGPA